MNLEKRDVLYIATLATVWNCIWTVLPLQWWSFAAGVLFVVTSQLGFVGWRKVADRVTAAPRRVKSVLTVTVATDRGVDQIERLALALPERWWRVYSVGAGISVYSWWVVWALIGAGGLWYGAHNIEIRRAVESAASGGSGSQSVTSSVADVVASIPALIVGLVVLGTVLVAGAWLIAPLFLPGTAVHEFGHAVGAVRAGIGIEEYGVILFGPAPAAAFIKLADHRWYESSPDAYRRLLAAGPMGNLAVGTVHLSIAAVLVVVAGGDIGTFATMIQVELPDRVTPLLALATAFASVATAEFLVSAFNAAPIPKTDGGWVRRIDNSRPVDWVPPAPANHALVEGVRGQR